MSGVLQIFDSSFIESVCHFRAQQVKGHKDGQSRAMMTTIINQSIERGPNGLSFNENAPVFREMAERRKTNYHDEFAEGLPGPTNINRPTPLGIVFELGRWEKGKQRGGWGSRFLDIFLDLLWYCRRA